jgi:hypothetical protein
MKRAFDARLGIGSSASTEPMTPRPDEAQDFPYKDDARPGKTSPKIDFTLGGGI